MTNTSDSGIDIARYVNGWSPEPVVETDTLPHERIIRFARTLDLDESRFAGPEIPILWQWIAFPDWPSTSELGADGHPEEGHFLPPLPHRKRMFAGSSITAQGTMIADVPITRRSSLESVTPKRGSTGEMVFVGVRHEYEQNGQLVRTESQKFVYRSETSDETRSFNRSTSPPAPDGDATWFDDHTVHAPTLFRFSALTFNSHRIHYDVPYATGVEGYPGLVVHGPLLAILMADLAERDWGTANLASFSFRLNAPVFDGDPFRVEGRPGDGVAALSVRTGVGTSATADARRA